MSRARVLLLLLLSLAAAHGGVGAAAQSRRGRSRFSPARGAQTKPNIANEVEKGEKKEEKKSEPDAAKPAATPKGQRQRRGKQPAAAAAPLEVTFRTDVPDAEIFLNSGGMSSQSLGRTDAEGKLTAKLSRGPHSVTASRAGHRILRQQIEVRPGNTSFAFNLSLPAPAAKPDGGDGAAASGAEDSKEAVTAEKALAGAAEVARRYLDPKESGGVTTADWDAAAAQVSAALERAPDDSKLQATSLFIQGQTAYLKNDYAGALSAFNRAALQMPEMVEAHYGRGNAYLATNQPVEATKAYQRAIALNSALALAYKGMGDALSKQGKTKEAGQFYDRAKSFGGTTGSTTAAAARNLKRQKRWAQALKQFQEIAEAEPSADLFIDIGDCYVGLEQPLSASQSYRRATELDPKGATAHYKFGEVMFNIREYAAAMDAMERALALDLDGTTINRKRARELANKAAEKLRAAK